MAAYEIPNLRFSAEAGANIARRRFVTVNTNEKGVVATAGNAAIGVSMNDPKSGEVLEIADGIVMVEAAVKIDAGTAVEVGADGKAAVLNTGIQVGIAVTNAGAAGELLSVKL